MLCQQMTIVQSDCTLLYKRSARMDLKSVSFILGEQLYQAKCSSQLSKMGSATRCIKMQKCYYLTIDKTNNVCTFYSQGATKFSTSNLQTYALEVPSIAVIIFIN